MIRDTSYMGEISSVFVVASPCAALEMTLTNAELKFGQNSQGANWGQLPCA